MQISQENSAYGSPQHDNFKKILHKKCGNYLYHNQVIELIEQYLLVKSNVYQFPIDNINIDENLTKKCCPDLKISYVLDIIQDYCLKCLRKIIQFPQNQRRQFSNVKVSFCSRCFLDIQSDKNIDQSQKTFIQPLLENIVMHCGKQSNYLRDNKNDLHQQHEQQCQTKNQKELMRQYSQVQNHQNDKMNDLETQLKKITKSQLIKKVLEMKLELSIAHQQARKYKDQSEKNFNQKQFYKIRSEKLQHENKMLKNKSEFSFQNSNSITLLNTNKNSSCLESSFSKEQSKIQSEIYNKYQSFSKEKFDDQNTLFHPQRIKQAQKIKQLPNLNSLNDSYYLQCVMEQKNEDDLSSNGKPVTRSQRKYIPINLINQNQQTTHMNLTTPVKGLTKKQSSKDSALLEHVNVPIVIKNANNNN